MKTATACIAALLGAVAASPRGVPTSLQNILDNTHGSSLYTYPTDLTRGIVPKRIHSHNDYWRDVPYWSAISVGAVSIEADVYLINGTLYVGHELSALTKERTFDALYIQPILKTLQRQNPTTPFADGSKTKNGIYDTASDQTVYLWIDLKTDGASTLPYVLNALQPLRDGGFLTSTDGQTRSDSRITAIGTGNTPAGYFAPGGQGFATASNKRDIFYDASLPDLDGSQSNITRNISPIASTDFSRWFGEVRNQSFNSTQLALLRSQVATAHAKGIGARYWELPGFPIGTRNAVWRTLYDEGVDLINVDDLEGAAGFWQNLG